MIKRTLIIDGEWNLKRNFEKRNTMFANGEHCGGSFGFLESLRAIVNKTMPDRVVVVWDGMMSGKLRHDIYPLYKANRDKSFDEDSYRMDDMLIEQEKRRKYSILQQKIKVKNYLEELFIRQTEVDLIEGDDLIGYYIKTKPEDEEVIIFSRDNDYLHLINEKVSIVKANDYDIINLENFKTRYGFIKDNCLLLKCFEGDTSDNVQGVDGIAIKTILKYFPKFSEEPYSVDRFIQESIELYKNKKLKVFEKIIGCRKTIERNKILFNLCEPLVNDQAIEEVKLLHEATLIEDEKFTDRSIYNAMKMMIKDGYKSLVWKENLELFFQPFYLLVTKEKEFASNKRIL
jgi:5'-3' exonuclease